MMNIRAIKTFPLDFVGEGWEKAYLKFKSFTLSDMKDKFVKLAEVDEKNVKDVTSKMQTMIDLLKDKFISGEVLSDDSGKLETMTKDDIPALPIGVIVRAVVFLSQDAVPQKNLE